MVYNDFDIFTLHRKLQIRDVSIFRELGEIRDFSKVPYLLFFDLWSNKGSNIKNFVPYFRVPYLEFPLYLIVSFDCNLSRAESRFPESEFLKPEKRFAIKYSCPTLKIFHTQSLKNRFESSFRQKTKISARLIRRRRAIIILLILRPMGTISKMLMYTL